MNIILSGNPLSTQHLYCFTCARGYPHQYMRPKGKVRKEQYQWETKSQWKEGIVYYPVELYVKLYFQDKKQRDVDNHSKIILDALTGIVFDDDNQIKKLTVEKLYDKENPRAEISIQRYLVPQKDKMS